MSPKKSHKPATAAIPAPSTDPNHNPVASPPSNPTSASLPSKPIRRTPSPSAYAVDTLFPKYELAIIGGPAQSGKTALLFQIATEWSNGRNLFEYESHPSPYCFVSCNQSLSACRASLIRSGADNPYMPMISMVDREPSDPAKKLSFEDVVAAVKAFDPETEVVFLDGIMSLCQGSIVDNSIVATFLRRLVHTLQEFELTLIATGRSAKPKDSTNASRSIDKFLGATAWTEYAETFIAIDNPKSRDPRDTRRTITIMPKRGKANVIQCRFTTDGKLVEVPAEMDAPEPLEALKIQCIEGREFKSAELLEIAEDAGISRAAFYRHLKLLLAQGYLVPMSEVEGKQVREGYYRVPYAN